MANIITINEFVQDLKIAQLSEASVANSVTALITKWEPRFLAMVMGLKLSKEFIAGIAVTPTPDPKWVAIRDGAEYENPFTEELVKYYGIKHSIASYVYWQYQGQNSTQTVGQGESLPGSENSGRVSPGSKMWASWASIKEDCQSLFNFLYVNDTNYDLDSEDFTETCHGYFLNSASEDLFESRNEFDI